MEYIVRYICLLIVLTCLISPKTAWAFDGNTKSVLNTFLDSDSIENRKEAFNIIVSNKEQFVPVVLEELKDNVNKHGTAPGELIHLAAYFKEAQYIPLLVKLINNKEYSYSECIYSCPVVFSLVIFKCFTSHPLPEGLDSSLTPVSDFKSASRRVCSREYSDDEEGNYPAGPGIDAQLAEMKARPTSEVLKLAGPSNKDITSRYAAAFVLENRTVNSEHLSELYWLATIEIKDTGRYDASKEYLNSIYNAIYRAESAKKAQGK